MIISGAENGKVERMWANGVEWQPIPRCDQCKHYREGEGGIVFLHCENDKIPDQGMNWFEVPGPGFGCVLWEPKP